MNYDFHWPTSDRPDLSLLRIGSCAIIENMVKLVPPDKIVMGIANYGYDWPAKTESVQHPVAQAVTFQQGVVTAVESDSDIVFDPDTLQSTLFLRR